MKGSMRKKALEGGQHVREREKNWGERKELGPGAGRSKGERCSRFIKRSQRAGNGRSKKHVRVKRQG